MLKIKDLLLKLLRRKMFQPLWYALFHFAKIGMNYWGGSGLLNSGEITVMKYVKSRLKGQTEPVIFDVGANRGQYAQEIVSVFNSASVFSFEPSAYTYSLLVKNLIEKGLTEKVKAYKLGLGKEDQSVKLYSNEKGSVVASVYKSFLLEMESEKYLTEEIEIQRIDTFCLNHGIGEIDFLKLDVEGHEFYALCGASTMLSERKIKFIQFEFGEFHIYARTFMKDFYDLLSENYQLYRIVSDGLIAINSYNPELEVFATANYLAELKQFP